VSVLRDAGERGHGGVILHLPFPKVDNGVEMAFHNSVIDNIMVAQDQLKTNVLQLFSHS